jgi:hypothetical protein
MSAKGKNYKDEKIKRQMEEWSRVIHRERHI